MKMGRTNKTILPSVRLYHRISLLFVGVSFLLLLLVLYLSVSKATVYITPIPQTVSVQFPIHLVKGVTGKDEMDGLVFENKVTRSKTFTLPQEGAEPVEAKATGTVTLINESGSAQDLIGNTRLLSTEGVLFRLDKAVTVAAHAQLDVIVSADKTGQAGEIAPSQFTIPGLQPNRQKEVYAVSVDKMAGGVRYVRALRQEDIDSAMAELKTQLATEAQADWEKTLVEAKNFDGYYSNVNITKSATDIALGTPTGVFTLTVDATVNGISYPSADFKKYAEGQIIGAVQVGEKLAVVNYDAAQLSVGTIDSVRGEAQLLVKLDGLAVIDISHQSLQTDRLVNKTVADVEATVANPELIKEVKVRFIPAWLKRMPTLPDHIEVKVADLPSGDNK